MTLDGLLIIYLRNFNKTTSFVVDKWKWIYYKNVLLSLLMKYFENKSDYVFFLRYFENLRFIYFEEKKNKIIQGVVSTVSLLFSNII